MSEKKRLRTEKKNIYPATVRPSDGKSTIRCYKCNGWDLNIRGTVVYTAGVKCNITPEGTTTTTTGRPDSSIMPIITIYCNKCNGEFDLNLYEDKGNIVIDRSV